MWRFWLYVDLEVVFQQVFLPVVFLTPFPPYVDAYGHPSTLQTDLGTSTTHAVSYQFLSSRQSNLQRCQFESSLMGTLH